MERIEFIGIEQFVICGVKNPVLTISGTILKKRHQFELVIDGKKTDFDIIESHKHFTIIKNLSNKDYRINLYVIVDGNRIFVASRLNRVRSRIKQKSLVVYRKVGERIMTFFTVLKRAVKFAWREYHFMIPPVFWKRYFKMFLNYTQNYGRILYYNPMSQTDYLNWIKENKKKENYEKFNYNPLISIIMPVYNIKKRYLSDCLNSVLNQTYSNFEVCIADDNSTSKETIMTLKDFARQDSRIVVVRRKENGNISEASNTAISMAKGDYIAFLDDDDLLDKDALYNVVKEINVDNSIDLIYTDEDKMDVNNKVSQPFFKPDFSPDTLMSFNYITHFAIYKKSLVDKVGGLRKEFDGAQDFDFVMRATEIAKNIKHISKVTYHWRMIPGSTALHMDSKNYALYAGKRVIEATLKRRNIPGKVIIPDKTIAHYIVEYTYKKEPSISILIPTKDYPEILNKCLKSIYTKTEYKNFEIIVLNNSSKKRETYDLFKKYKKEYSNFKVVDVNMEFNYSKINNIGVNEAKGDYVVLLNNDTEVISPKWLHYMVGYAMQDHIGAVGVKLLYPDNTIQHCGVVLGIANTASHFGIGINKNDNGPFARYMVPYNNGAVTAACLMVSKNKYLEVGGLDEELKVAFNDVEFNVKLLKAGYYNVCLPQVKLYHYESKTRGLDTTGEKYKRFLVESELLRQKAGSYITRDPFYNDNLSKMYPMMLDIKSEMYLYKK
jgi:GT2 family glycosyltransferase